MQSVCWYHQQDLKCRKPIYILWNFSSLSTNSTRQKSWTATYRYRRDTGLYSLYSSCNTYEQTQTRQKDHCKFVLGKKLVVSPLYMQYEDQTCEAVLLADASNTFNLINRNVFLHNVTNICPTIAIGVKNCYSTHSQLFIIGGNEIRSCE